jgi:hypothetical protein
LEDQYNILIRKLDQFIRKYYKNKLIRGTIYCLGLLLGLFLIITLTEYFGHFNTLARTILFWSFLGVNLVIFIRFIIIPFAKLYRIGSIISHEEASGIIGRHFPDVSDKLLNTLQLKKMTGQGHLDLTLVKAGIDQKIRDLKPVPFSAAVDFTVNRKYLKFFIIPVLIIAVILVSSPDIITEPASRLVKYAEHFETPLPYRIQVMNDNFDVLQNDDFTLFVRVDGEEVPDRVFLQVDNYQVRLEKESITDYRHTFMNVQKNTRFRIVTGRYQTGEFELKVLPKPVILDFEIMMDYPAYTRKKSEVKKNNGDLMVPAGTDITWKFSTQNTDNILMYFDGKIETLGSKSPVNFEFGKKAFQSESYVIKTSNRFVKNRDSLTYSIVVIPDAYPMISVEELRDSEYDRRLYFNGFISDDYGLTKLTFNHRKKSRETKPGSVVSEDLPIDKSVNTQPFYYFFNTFMEGFNPGDELEYYFEVWDNDGINGRKSTRSQVMTFRIPTIEEINLEKEASNQEIKSEMENALREVKELQQEIDQINRRLIHKQELNWQDKEQVKQLLEKHSNLQQKMEELKLKNQEKAFKEQQFKEIDMQILEKQKQLEELFDKLIENQEIRELFEELQKLIDEMDKEKINKLLDDIRLSNEDIEKMLDRNLELFRQLEFEHKLEETIQKLNELSEEQLELSKLTEDRQSDLGDIKEKQEEIEERFEQVMDDLDDLERLNNEMEWPNQFDKMEEDQQGIMEDIETGKDQLDKKQRKNASGSQRNASQKMQKMAQAMFDMQQDMIQQSMGEDIHALRDILENLIQISFDQEDLMMLVGSTSVNDPLFTGLIQDQKKLKDDLKMVSDSLFALSKRQIMIEPFVTSEIQKIDQNIEHAMQSLNNRKTSQAAGQQQYVMTSVNNLALMLSETLSQMMQMMMMQNKSSSSCKNSGMPKPGQGKGSMQSLRRMQEQLNRQIEQMKSGKDQQGEGEKQGQPDRRGQSMSEQLARSAAEQEFIRNEMRKLAEELDKAGEFGTSRELKKIMEEMEKTETDLVNKMITQETLMRQKQILTRLLESERAEMEREKDEQRESEEGKIFELRNPEDFLKYKKVQKNEVELLRTVHPSLTPFYKKKVDQYFFNFEELLER